MSRSIEIELKFEVLDRAEIARFVEPLEVIGKKRIVDVYLDTQEGDLFKRSIFVRIRNNATFDIKFNQEDFSKSLYDTIEHTHCDEVSVQLPFTESSITTVNETLKTLGLKPMTSLSLDDFMQRNNLIRSMIIDKERTSYDDGEFHIDRDTVDGLGEYLEIEKMTDEHADHDNISREMKEHLKGLQLKHVDVGYNELYWRKHNFDLYLRGKYLLIEDRKKYRSESVRP